MKIIKIGTAVSKNVKTGEETPIPVLHQPVPTKTSELENDSGYITGTDVPTKVSELENDSDYATVQLVRDVEENLVNTKAWSSDVETLFSITDGLTTDKQDKLTPGTGITISEDNIISVSSEPEYERSVEDVTDFKKVIHVPEGDIDVYISFNNGDTGWWWGSDRYSRRNNVEGNMPILMIRNDLVAETRGASHCWVTLDKNYIENRYVASNYGKLANRFTFTASDESSTKVYLYDYYTSETNTTINTGVVLNGTTYTIGSGKAFKVNGLNISEMTSSTYSRESLQFIADSFASILIAADPSKKLVTRGEVEEMIDERISSLNDIIGSGVFE